MDTRYLNYTYALTNDYSHFVVSRLSTISTFGNTPLSCDNCYFPLGPRREEDFFKTAEVVSMAGSIPVDVLPTDTGSEEVSITAGPRRKIIIDTDVGIDDAQAIFLALADPSVEILAITCVGGNTTLENGTK